MAMPSPSVASVAFASQQVVIYVGLFIFTASVIGGPLILIVFRSLRTFRQNSCAFYLTIMSIVNTLHMFTGLLTFIMINGFDSNWTNMSLFYCKFRPFFVRLGASISFTCISLATCFNRYWHRWCNIKLAGYIIIGFFVLWFIHGIPSAIYFNVITPSTNSNQTTCSITNLIFQPYYTFGYVLSLWVLNLLQ